MSNKIKNKERKVFWDDLPRHENGSIDWNSSVGNKVKFIYDDIIGEVEIVKYVSTNQMLEINYENEISYNINTEGFKKCRLGYMFNKITNEFKVAIGCVFKDNNRNLTITNSKKIKTEQKPDKKGRVYYKDVKFYKYSCNTCTYNGWIIEGDLIRGRGCACCAGKVVVPEINSIWATDPWMCDLGVSEEDAKGHTRRSNRKITVKCPDCGREKKMSPCTILANKTIFCPCSDGLEYPPKFIINFLEQLDVKYVLEYAPIYLKLNGSQKRSDFYLEHSKLIIEADGGLGHKDGIIHGKSDKTIEECVAIDKWKDEQHMLHGVKTIRINCFESNMEYIKNSILKSELVNYFDLSKVNWLECEKFALKNMVKEVCDYWNQKEEWETAKDLCDKFKLSKPSIIKYLKKGNIHGWSHYDADEENKKKNIKNGENLKRILCKPVEIFKDDISLGVFESAKELERISEKEFGVKLKHSSISDVCNNKKSLYKGYYFKFASKPKNNKAS